MSSVALRTPDFGASPWPSSAERLVRLVYRTSAAARQLRRVLAERVARWELTDSEMLILWLCWAPGKSGKVQGELALALGISPAQTSALVEALRKRGFLQHERSPLDRRRQIWRLTAEGEALLIEMGAAIADLAKRVDAEVTLDQQRLADELSEQLLEVLLERPRLKAFDPEQAEQLQDGGAR